MDIKEDTYVRYRIGVIVIPGVRIFFMLSRDDFDRLMYLKNEVDDKLYYSANHYAARLLENLLHQRCPDLQSDPDDVDDDQIELEV